MKVLRVIAVWVKSHKVKSVLLLFLLVFLIELATIPFFSIPRLRSEIPPETAMMRQRIEEASDEGKTLKITQRWIPLSRLPKHVVNAIVAAEDGTFFSHNGFDWFEVQESIERNMKEQRAVRGASTITQQLAKNLYLSTSKDPVRKLKEAAITVLLEKNLSKHRILEIYVNVIEWGRGVFGIEAAAQTYFGKSAAFLTLDEATRLAAVIPSPLRNKPNENTRYVIRRKNIVLARMTARQTVPQTPIEGGRPDSLLLPVPLPEEHINADTPDTADTTEENNGL